MSVKEQFTLQPVMYTLGFLIRRQTCCRQILLSTFCYSISSFSTTVLYVCNMYSTQVHVELREHTLIAGHLIYGVTLRKPLSFEADVSKSGHSISFRADSHAIKALST